MHHQFNIQQLYALPTLYLWVLYLSENKQLLVSHHKLIGFYNRDEKCLQRGTGWGFKQSGLRFVFKRLILVGWVTFNTHILHFSLMHLYLNICLLWYGLELTYHVTAYIIFCLPSKSKSFELAINNAETIVMSMFFSQTWCLRSALT